MTREQAKGLLPVIQAFAEGKTIQSKFRDKTEWIDIKNGERVSFNTELCDYRIKPEAKYRPFSNKEECRNEMLKHKPFGWLMRKEDGILNPLTEISDSNYFDSICAKFTFADGTPFGVKEE